MNYHKVLVLGGASPYWTPRNVSLMACSASLREAEVVLLDVAHDRAVHMAQLCNKMLARAYPDARIRVTACPAIDDAMSGTDVVIPCYRNGGHDVEGRINAIARKYGSHQCCFTAGPGAAIYLATQGPVLIALVRSMLRHAPNALLINCSNPLPAMCMLAVKAGAKPRSVLGFCGALAWYRRFLARYLEVDQERIAFRIGGTNHCTFFTEVLLDGRDAYPIIREAGKTRQWIDMGEWGRSTAEIKTLAALGYLCAPGHTTDIYPMFHGEWLPPLESAPKLTADNKQGFLGVLEAYARGENVDWAPPTECEVPFLWLDALAGESDQHLHSINTMSLNAVSNLPEWSVPDLEYYLDERGVTPLAGPPLPEQIAEVVRRHHVSFDMAARAVLARDHELLVRAIQLCPFGNYMESAEQILADAREAFGSQLIF
ncbi:MAG TPA: hypothetical protein VM223_16170 [Planctomycetota bacterium]|nr:hypothetical protein [Planctomycetota bacterium]